jgi:uncharacterized protein (DUF1330 family)
MAKGYWVVHLDVADAAGHAQYQAFVNPFLAANNGRFVVRGGERTVEEGSARGRTVVVEFPSYADAQRVYHSAEYQEGSKARFAASVSDFVIVEGYEG